MSEMKSEFRFILNGVRSESLQAVAQELMALFPLDLPNALNIARNAPIILVDKLNAQQARNIGTYAVRLRALGADVQVTSQPVGKLQVLRWPLMPDIAKRPGNHVICPNCGARLHVQVHMPPVEAVAAPQPATQASPGAPQQPVQFAPAPSQAPPPAQPAVEEEEVVLEPVGEEPPPVPGGEVVLEEAPVQLEEAPAPGQPLGGAGTCRVTLVGRIKGSKKRSAAELIAYYLGVSEDEAISQLNKTVVTVGKDLTPEQAETCKAQFAEIGVKVTIKG